MRNDKAQRNFTDADSRIMVRNGAFPAGLTRRPPCPKLRAASESMRCGRPSSEPVFGQIKAAIGFDRFSLRGIAKVASDHFASQGSQWPAEIGGHGAPWVERTGLRETSSSLASERAARALPTLNRDPDLVMHCSPATFTAPRPDACLASRLSVVI